MGPPRPPAASACFPIELLLTNQGFRAPGPPQGFPWGLRASSSAMDIQERRAPPPLRRATYPGQGTPPQSCAQRCSRGSRLRATLQPSAAVHCAAIEALQGPGMRAALRPGPARAQKRAQRCNRGPHGHGNAATLRSEAAKNAHRAAFWAHRGQCWAPGARKPCEGWRQMGIGGQT